MKENKSTSLRVYLIRHGETEWTLSGQHTGLTDIPLTKHGEEEATELAGRLERIQFARVLCSPLLRAKQTCRLAGLEGVAEAEPNLVEWDYGDYEGRRSPDIRETRAGWNIFQDGCPNGEMPETIAARADEVIRRVLPLQGNVALFSHGHFGAALAVRWLKLPILMGRHFPLRTVSISVFGFSSSQPELPVIDLWNSTRQRME